MLSLVQSEDDTPAPAPGRALVATAFSVISSGTEAAALSAGARSALERLASAVADQIVARIAVFANRGGGQPAAAPAPTPAGQ